MKIYCDTNQLPQLTFCGSHTNPHGERGLGKHYHIRFDQNLGHGICEILRIPCACVACTSMLDQPWISGVQTTKQSQYQPAINCTYWTVLGPYKNWNIIHLTPKSIPSEAFDEIHQVVLDEISSNMVSLVQLDMYGAINTDVPQQMYYMSFNSYQMHTQYKAIQQFTDKLFLLMN